MKQHYKQFSVFLGFVMVLVLALGFNVALLAQEKEAQTGEEDLDWGLRVRLFSERGLSCCPGVFSKSIKPES